VAASSTRASHSIAVTCRDASSQADPAPSSGGVTYPAAAVITAPGPVRRPREYVSPEVSACSLMPSSRRPLSTEASACPPSCAIVITFLASRHASVVSTMSRAVTPLTATTHTGATGCCCHSAATRCMHHRVPVRG
jgi:hypothetical protein